MRLGFAGTPGFAAAALEALLGAGHECVLVLTQPDRPGGRGLKAQASAVKALASSRGLTIEQPATIKDAALAARIEALALDALIVAAYGLIVPGAMLAAPRLGAINIHASLLPRWRGAAPIQRALLAGDAETGITIMQMDEGLDTGAILAQQSVAIDADDTAGTLHDKLASLGARMIVSVLADLPKPRPLRAAGVTYAAKIERSEARLDWRDGASVNERKVRAFNPVPGAYTELDGALLKVWRAVPVPGAGGTPGTVQAADADGILVACGEGSLRLLEVQRAGGKRLGARAFLAGTPLAAGARLGG